MNDTINLTVDQLDNLLGITPDLDIPQKQHQTSTPKLGRIKTTLLGTFIVSIAVLGILIAYVM